MNGIYIAGAMTGLPQLNYPAFHALAAELRDLGFHVENPAEHPALAGGAWEDYMRMAIAQVVTCDTLVVLDGWAESRGARVEVELAVNLGIPVIRAGSFDAAFVEELRA